MITSSEIINKRFSIETNGYCQDEVDEYLNQLSEQIDSLSDTYGNLRRKVIAEGERPELIKRESLSSYGRKKSLEFSEEGNGYNKGEVDNFIEEIEREIYWLSLNNQKMREMLQSKQKRSYQFQPRTMESNRINNSAARVSRICPRCGNTVLDAHQFCPTCGLSLTVQPIPPVQCPVNVPQNNNTMYYQPQNLTSPAPTSYARMQSAYPDSGKANKKSKWPIIAISALAIIVLVIMARNAQQQNQKKEQAKSTDAYSASITVNPTSTPETIKVEKAVFTQPVENKTPEELCQEGRYSEALEIYLQTGNYSSDEKNALSRFVKYYSSIRKDTGYQFSPINTYGNAAKDAAVYIEKNYKGYSSGIVYQIYNVTEAALYYSIDDLFNQGFHQQGIDFAKHVDRNYTGAFATQIIHLADYIQNGGKTTSGSAEKKETVTAQPTKKPQGTSSSSTGKTSMKDVTDSDIRGFLYNTAIGWIKQRYPSYKNGKFPFSSYIGRDDISIKTYTENGNTYYQVKMDVIVNQITHGFSVIMLQKGTGMDMSVSMISINELY